MLLYFIARRDARSKFRVLIYCAILFNIGLVLWIQRCHTLSLILVTIHQAPGISCSKYTVIPCLVCCPFYAIPIILQVNEKFHKLERGYRDCIKRTRDKTRIYSIPHDAPGA